MRISLPTILAALFAIPCLAVAQPASCFQFSPGGRLPALLNPKIEQRVSVLCNDGYAAAASGVTHGTLWSAEHLTASDVASARDTPRAGMFHSEERLPYADQAQIDDYRRSGYDRGHMTPSGDMPNATAQEQSFSLANVVPQTAQLNRGIWEGIETAVRNLAVREGEVYLVTGPAFVGSELRVRIASLWR
jgi:endonuclease G